MSTDKIYRIISSDSDETEQLGHTLGNRFRGGEVIVLTSDLGGGKTALVRGLAAGIGSKDHVASPTFTISREYKSDNLTLYHFDFYRLEDPGIVTAELQEYIDEPGAVIAIEWGEIVESALPHDRIDIRLDRTGDTTRAIVVSCSERFAYVIDNLPAMPEETESGTV